MPKDAIQAIVDIHLETCKTQRPERLLSDLLSICFYQWTAALTNFCNELNCQLVSSSTSPEGRGEALIHSPSVYSLCDASLAVTGLRRGQLKVRSQGDS